MTALPDWARQMQPVDMAGCALVLGISRRTLVDVLKKHPHYERRGTKKVFYPQHVDALREALACPISSSNRAKASGTPLAPLPESAFDKAWALATKREPKNSRRSSKHGNGNVIPMATQRSGRSDMFTSPSLAPAAEQMDMLANPDAGAGR